MARTDLVPVVTDIVLYKRAPGGGLRLNAWQWGFVLLAPIFLIIIDLRLLGGWLMTLAPAAFWTAAFLGWIPLALSQKRWDWPVDPGINGAMWFCMGLAAIGSISPIIIFFFVSIGNLLIGQATFDDVWKRTLLSGIALILTWPLLFTAGAYRRQLRLRVRWRPDVRSRPGYIGMVILPALMLVAEGTDRVWFGGIDKRLHSGNIEQVLDAAHDLRFYPVTLMTRTDEVCSGLYAHGRETLADPEILEKDLDTAWGDRAGAVRAQAEKFFGSDATLICADALSSGPF